MKRLLSRKLIVGISGCCLAVILTAAYRIDKPTTYHNHDELVQMRMMMNELPNGTNSVFAGSGKCAGCHGHDPVAFANVTSELVDVNPTDDWRATMMANSAKDPFWKAKVSHEVAINPQHQEALEDKCLSCHAPLGKFAAAFDGIPHYSMEMLSTDTLGRDGVSCGACHQQQIDILGQSFSGLNTYNPDTIWGPYVSEEQEFPIFSTIMTNFAGFEPVGNHKTEKSEMCATCHTLQTETVDLEGNFTGGQFVEQATYHEWVNSAYNNDEMVAKECQGCHMPRLDEEIVIASGYLFLPGRTPFGQHWFVGGNSFMLELMKNNIDTLGITADESHFDKVIDRTIAQLSNETSMLELTEENITGDTASYAVKLTNLAGHKFPSGYPSRRAYIEFTAYDDDGNIFWQSGGLQPNYEVFGQNADYEPHYDLITQQEEVQIYELVMGDVNNDVTTVLERADHPIKDNRLAPLGFSTTHFAYDTTMVVGSAATDPNFNHVNGIEGSGTDEIRYHIPVLGYDGTLTISARLMYQSAPPKWNEELFSVSTPEIDFFETLYWAEGADPVEVAFGETQSVIVSAIPFVAQGLQLFPNPTIDGKITIQSYNQKLDWINVYDSRGKLLQRVMSNRMSEEILLPDTKGTYLIEIHSDQQTHIEKVVRN